LVADIASKFLRDFDPEWERGWIAEMNGDRVGSIFLTRRSKTVGQLRMLLVEPSARGQGLGARLVGECVSHARHVGFKKMGLYTSKGLDAARRLYEAEAFQLVREEPEEIWGKKHTAQWWELVL
jgi:GNAT superfamily N-acetyltransferase